MVSNDDIYWISKNGLWKIGKWKTDRGMQWYIEDTATGYNDNPIVYEDGRVTFDEPYVIPKYVKKQFKILTNKERRVDDFLLEMLLNENRQINDLLHHPLFKTTVTENMDNPEVERIVSEMTYIANENFISRENPGVADLLLELDDEIPSIHKTMKEIMLGRS